MIGYKAFDKDLCCRGMQYEVGKVYVTDAKDEELKLCTDTCLHFCRELFRIESETSYKLSESRVCEVIAEGRVVGDGSKYGTNILRVLRELTKDEIKEYCNNNSGNGNSGNGNSGNFNSGNFNSGYGNSGNGNSGNGNSGNGNSGYCNSGNRNSGNFNSGNFNSGNFNSGNRNSGYGNSGNRNSGNRNSGNNNSGNRNSGNFNSGNFNSGNCNSGYCNSNEPKIRIFNKETNIGRGDIVFPNFFYFDLAVFTSYDTATDEERNKYKKEIEDCGGFLKTIPYKTAWRLSWDKASDEDRRKCLALPNWDNEIFKEISGIDVEAELGLKKGGE